MRYPIVLIAAALSACAQPSPLEAKIAQFTAQDAAQAARINPPNATCYQGFGTIALADTASVGILSLAAIDMQLQSLLRDPACAPVVIAIMNQVLKTTPAAPLIP